MAGRPKSLDTKRHVDDGIVPPKPKKLKGNQNVREDLTGQFAKETNAGKPGFNVETEKPKFNYMEMDLGRHFSPWMQGVIYAAACHERFGTAETRKALDKTIDGK